MGMAAVLCGRRGKKGEDLLIPQEHSLDHFVSSSFNKEKEPMEATHKEKQLQKRDPTEDLEKEEIYEDGEPEKKFLKTKKSTSTPISTIEGEEPTPNDDDRVLDSENPLQQPPPTIVCRSTTCQ